MVNKINKNNKKMTFTLILNLTAVITQIYKINNKIIIKIQKSINQLKINFLLKNYDQRKYFILTNYFFYFYIKYI